MERKKPTCHKNNRPDTALLLFFTAGMALIVGFGQV